MEDVQISIDGYQFQKPYMVTYLFLKEPENKLATDQFLKERLGLHILSIESQYFLLDFENFNIFIKIS